MKDSFYVEPSLEEVSLVNRTTGEIITGSDPKGLMDALISSDDWVPYDKSVDYEGYYHPESDSSSYLTSESIDAPF